MLHLVYEICIGKGNNYYGTEGVLFFSEYLSMYATKTAEKKNLFLNKFYNINDPFNASHVILLLDWIELDNKIESLFILKIKFICAFNVISLIINIWVVNYLQLFSFLFIN